MYECNQVSNHVSKNVPYLDRILDATSANIGEDQDQMAEKKTSVGALEIDLPLYAQALS